MISLTLKDVKQTARVCETDLGVAMLQALQKDLNVRLALCERAGYPFCAASGHPTAVRVHTRTTGKRALPCLEVFRHLWHLNV